MKADREDALVRPAGLRGVLAFMLPALIGVLAIGAVISWKQELFVSRTPIYVFTDNAIGMTKGMPVKVFGLTVGSVGDIEIVPGTPGAASSRVRVRFDISSEYLQHVHRDSKARLMREALVGQSLIEIVPGSVQSRPVAKNEVIAFERSKSLGELSEELNKSLAPVLVQVKEAIGELRSPDGQVQKSMAQMNTLMQELPETNRKLQNLMTTTERAVGTAGRAIEQASSKTETALEQIEKTAGAISTATPGILLKIDRAAESVARTSEAARKLSEESSRRLPLLIDDGTNLVRDASDMMTGAKQSWPLRIMLPQPGVKTLPIDTQETSGRP